jgi:hypothetical protein
MSSNYCRVAAEAAACPSIEILVHLRRRRRRASDEADGASKWRAPQLASVQIARGSASIVGQIWQLARGGAVAPAERSQYLRHRGRCKYCAARMRRLRRRRRAHIITSLILPSRVVVVPAREAWPGDNNNDNNRDIPCLASGIWNAAGVPARHEQANNYRDGGSRPASRLASQSRLSFTRGRGVLERRRARAGPFEKSSLAH